MEHFYTRELQPELLNTDALRDPTNRAPNTGRAFARFFTRPIRDEKLSAARGRQVSKEVEMVMIIIPGDKNSLVERRAREADKQRFPKEYEAFRKQQDFVPDGTLLETWGLLSRAQIEDLKYAGLYTVEDLAAVPDSNLPALGIGGRTLRKHAEAFLKTCETGKVPAQLIEENETLRKRVDMMVEQVEALTKRLELALSESGKDVSEIDSPVIETARALAESSSTVPKTVAIPADYDTMNLKALRALCSEFTNAPITTKADAFDLIREYQESI